LTREVVHQFEIIPVFKDVVSTVGEKTAARRPVDLIENNDRADELLKQNRYHYAVSISRNALAAC